MPPIIKNMADIFWGEGGVDGLVIPLFDDFLFKLRISLCGDQKIPSRTSI